MSLLSRIIYKGDLIRYNGVTVTGATSLECLVSLQAVEKVLFPHLPAYWANLQAVLDDYTVSNAQVKADGHKVYGAILVSRSLMDISQRLTSGISLNCKTRTPGPFVGHKLLFLSTFLEKGGCPDLILFLLRYWP